MKPKPQEGGDLEISGAKHIRQYVVMIDS